MLKKFLAERYFRTLVLVALASSWLLAGLAWADPQGPTAEDHQIAMAVTSLMKKEHLLRHPLDDEMAARWMKNFLKALDPRKMYFYQSDVDEFKKQQNNLPDHGSQGRRQLSPIRFSTAICSAWTNG